jgi:hypothetical protein
MDWKLRVVGVVAVLGCVVPLCAAQDKKDGDKKPAAKPEPPKEKMISVGTMEGRVTKVELGQKCVTIQRKVPVLSGGRVQAGNKDEEYSTTEDVQVFYMNPPVEYDEKGKPKKPNPKDVKKPVKGPGGKGYLAEFDSLKKDQIVRLYLVKKKVAPTYPRPKKDELAEENKPLANAIYILVEPRN